MIHINQNSNIRTSVLIIGAGIAGILLAIELVDKGIACVLACKGSLFDSNTAYAQGGIAAVNDAVVPSQSADSIDKHVHDTIQAGAGLCDPDTVSQILGNGPILIQRLSQLGLNFDRRPDGSLDLHLEGGHSVPRVLHTKDATGISVARALISSLSARMHKSPALITVLEGARAEELLSREGCIVGARVTQNSAPLTISAKFTVLATGGTGALFARTTNPSGATGDGIALAYRAGATLSDMEFTQFHPTALCLPGAPSFLISEAVRGAGAILRDAHLEPFMGRFHEDADLATRDIVARAIQQVIEEQQTDHVFLDLQPIGRKSIESKFPMIVASLAKFGVDCTQELIPVAPAAHYFMGGILTDACGSTDLPGLFAIGECAASGLHGANRLASNSLLEGGVMALLLASEIARTNFTNSEIGLQNQIQLADEIKIDTVSILDTPPLVQNKIGRLRSMMYKKAGVLRSKDSLESIEEHLSTTFPDPAGPVQSTLSGLMTRAALLRNESRGSHSRRDFPSTDDAAYGRRLHVKSGAWNWAPLTRATRNSVSRPAWQPILERPINQIST